MGILHFLKLKNLSFDYNWLKQKFEGKSQIRVLVVEDSNENPKTSSLSYKHLDFECDSDIAEDIKNTFSQIIMFCDSVYSRNYDESTAALTSTKWSRRLFKMNEKNKFF